MIYTDNVTQMSKINNDELDKNIVGKDTVSLTSKVIVNNVLLSTVVMNVMKNNNVLCPVKPLLDSGFQTISFITETENMLKKLNFK